MNARMKKENGVVFTPEWVVRFMVDEVFTEQQITGHEKILDAGCGEGVFSSIAAAKFSELSGKPIHKVIEENVFFVDLSPEYVTTTKQNLQKLTTHKIKKFNAITDDFCFHPFHETFDFIIGNPPYVRIQNLNNKRNQLQKSFHTASSGSIDLYFCFFERALSLLKPRGRIAFITPNSHFYSAAGKNLRALLLTHLVKMVNFDHFQVFKDVTAYTVITFLQKTTSDRFFYTEHHNNNCHDMVFKEVLTQPLQGKRWEFIDAKRLTRIVQMNQRYATLKDIADIHYGIATLKDDLYIFSPQKQDRNYFFIDTFKIEKELCVPIIKASTYKGSSQNLFLIFPYLREKIIPHDTFKKLYPEAYKYFLHHKQALISRDKGGGERYEEFYAFGRNQGLKTSFGKKIITSTMNLTPRFYVIDDEKTSFFAGYCIKPKGDIDLKELCEALNSELMSEHIRSVSKSYRGGYKSYAKSFLKDFVHPQFVKTQPVLF